MQQLQLKLQLACANVWAPYFTSAAISLLGQNAQTVRLLTVRLNFGTSLHNFAQFKKNQTSKQIAQQILPQLTSDEVVSNYDSSTNGLINHTKMLK